MNKLFPVQPFLFFLFFKYNRNTTDAKEPDIIPIPQQHEPIAIKNAKVSVP